MVIIMQIHCYILFLSIVNKLFIFSLKEEVKLYSIFYTIIFNYPYLFILLFNIQMKDRYISINYILLLFLFFYYVSSSSNIFVQCPTGQQFANCTGCLPENNKPKCYCFNTSFSFGGRCFTPYYPCKQVLIEPIISNTGNSLWDLVISKFWDRKIQQAVNQSSLKIDPVPQFMNFYFFTNMTFSQKRGWTQAYYVYLVYKKLNLTANLTQSDLIIKAINFVSASLIGKSTMQKWELFTKFYNQTFNKKQISDQFTLSTFRPAIKPILPCSGCHQMYGIILSSQNPFCSKCSPNCLECIDETSKCTNCSSGFFLNNNLCQLCQFPNCINCNQNECLKCKDGYSIVNKTCTRCSESCQTCSGLLPNNCTSCIDFFDSKSPNSQGKCYQCTQNQCAICSPTNITNCSKCFDGYYLNSQNICSLCPNNCLIFHQNTCYVCQPGFGLINGICKQCNVKGCRACNHNLNNCIICFEPYFLMDSGKCILNYIYNHQNYLQSIKCRSNCDFCYNNNTELCFQCHQRYYLDGKRCKKCIPGCLLCVDSVTCLSCVSGYALVQNKTCQLCPQDCRECSSTNITQCLDCRVGYDINSGKCNKLDNQLCLVYGDNNTKCISCLPGFALTSQGSCISCQVGCNQTCNPYNISQCRKTRFQISRMIKFKYIYITEGCLGQVNGNCIQPEQGYLLKQIDNRVKVISCLYPCVFCSQQICFNCDSGYTLSNGKCILNLTCNPNCTICQPGSQRNSSTNQCKLCPVENCESCLNGTCLQCHEGFYLENGTCKSCPRKCKTCYDSRNCRVCQSGYIWPTQFRTYSYDCVKCDSNCRTCKLSPNLCTSCEEGRILMNFICVKRYHVNYQYILDYNYTIFVKNRKSEDFIASIKLLTSVSYTDVLISSIKEGSVKIEGTINSQNYKTAENIMKILKTKKLPNFEVKGSAFSLMNYTQTISCSQQGEGICKQTGKESKIEPGIIALIVCLVVIAILATIGIVYYCYKKKKPKGLMFQGQQSDAKGYQVQLQSGSDIKKR